MTEKKIIYISDLHVEWVDGGWCEGITFEDYMQGYREQGAIIVVE